jgi:hypothetical protein
MIRVSFSPLSGILNVIFKLPFHCRNIPVSLLAANTGVQEIQNTAAFYMRSALCLSRSCFIQELIDKNFLFLCEV